MVMVMVMMMVRKMMISNHDHEDFPFSRTAEALRVLMGSFRESPGGTQIPVAPRAGSFVPGPVFDDSYTL